MSAGAAPVRRLMLLRHAKADAPAGSASDLERSLAADGRSAAGRLGEYMAQHGLVPDRVLVSPARRTRETWALLKLDGAAVETSSQLYDASSDRIVAMVRAVAPETGTLLLVAHNPGLQELAGKLMTADDIEGRARVGGFPPAALAVLDFSAPSWGAVAPGAGRLERFVDPRRLPS